MAPNFCDHVCPPTPAFRLFKPKIHRLAFLTLLMTLGSISRSRYSTANAEIHTRVGLPKGCMTRKRRPTPASRLFKPEMSFCVLLYLLAALHWCSGRFMLIT